MPLLYGSGAWWQKNQPSKMTPSLRITSLCPSFKRKAPRLPLPIHIKNGSVSRQQYPFTIKKVSPQRCNNMRAQKIPFTQITQQFSLVNLEVKKTHDDNKQVDKKQYTSNLSRADRIFLPAIGSSQFRLQKILLFLPAFRIFLCVIKGTSTSKNNSDYIDSIEKAQKIYRYEYTRLRHLFFYDKI